MDVTDLGTYTKKALLRIAKEHGIKGVSRLRKQELADHLLRELLPHPQPPPAAPLPRRTAVEQKQQASPSPEIIPPGSLPVSLTDHYPSSLAAAPAEQSEPAVALDAMDALARTCAVTPDEPFEPAAPDSKFFLGPQPPAAIAEPDVLPASYNDNRLILLAQSPHKVHVYWDFNGERWTQAQNYCDVEHDKLVLRIFDVTYIEFNGANAWSSTDVEITSFATSWRVAVPRADAAYCAEIGYRSHSGQFISLGRSNVAITPRNDISPSTTVRWLTPRERRASTQDSASPPHPAQTHERPFWASTPTSISQLSTPSSSEHTSSWGASHRSSAPPPKR